MGPSDPACDKFAGLDTKKSDANMSPKMEDGTFDNRGSATGENNGDEALRVAGLSGDLNLDDEKNILHRRSVDKENAADQVVSSSR